MIDRVLDLVHKFTSAQWPKEVVEEAVLQYQQGGNATAIAFLEKSGYTSEEATTLVKQIHKEYIKSNKNILVYRLVMFLIPAVLLFFSITSQSYLFGFVALLFALRYGYKAYRFFVQNKLHNHI